ncbi:AAA family ATPase [bacterium]|nr:AAA family ATPase [bacterium]
MLKIIICNDPFFSTKNHPHALKWDQNAPEQTFSTLINTIHSNKAIALPYAEYLIINDERALQFVQAHLASSSDITLYCRTITLPRVVLQYAIIEKEESGYEQFKPLIDALPIDDSEQKAIFENLKGLSFSKIESLLERFQTLPPAELLPTLLEHKRNMLRNSEVLEVVHMNGMLTDIGGLSELKQWIISRQDNFGEKARSFGIPMPKGMLMLGVQGCGKSLTAKVIANIWNFPLVRLDFINLFKQGKSVEELLREAISIVEGFAPIVLWIDELEKALSQEGESSEIRRVLGWLMTWMQEKKDSVFLVATANQVKLLPPELLRKGRFDEIFFVDLPTKNERKEIFAIHLARRDRAVEQYDISALAEQADNFSGAEIEQVVIDALITAFTKEQELSQHSLEEAIRKTVPLAVTYEEHIKELRLWSRHRARNASGNARISSFFNRDASE